VKGPRCKAGAFLIPSPPVAVPQNPLHERTVSDCAVPAPMRRIDLQIVQWRRRAQAPARPTAVPGSRFSPDGDPRTGAQDHHPPGTLLHLAAPWSHAPGSDLPPTSGAGKHACGRLDHPFHHRRREAECGDGPGSALPRGPSLDGLQTDSTVDDGRVARSGAGTPSSYCPLINRTIRHVRSGVDQSRLRIARFMLENEACEATGEASRATHIHSR